MRRPSRPAPVKAARSLLVKLTESPALPAFIRRLPTPTLQRLVEHVGLADAGPLIEMTSTAQLRELFEVSLWQNLVPGQQEVLRPDRFLQWLDVLLEVSPAFAAERLIELGETFLTLQLDPLLEVIAFSTATPHRDDEPCLCMYCELIERGECAGLFGDYLVSAVHHDEWDAVHSLLTELDNVDAEFLMRVLARCCGVPTALGFADDGRALLADETHARETRRGRAGFVTPPIAAAFLKVARSEPIDAICASDGYDDISRRYFEQLSASGESPDVDAEADVGPAESAPAAAPAQLRVLQAALVEAEIVGDRGLLLLSGPRSTRQPVLELQARLDRLQQTDPATFSRRLLELVFLANVLMAGTWHQGGRFTESDAAQAALACANLGMDYAVGGPFPGQSRADAVESLLTQPAGLIRCFRVGWHLLQQLPRRAATALLDVLHAPDVRDRLAHKRWILDDVDAALREPDLLQLIERGEFEAVGDTLVLLGLVLDPHACECLRMLIADFPRFPLQLNIGFRPGHRAASSSRYLTAVQDLERIDVFLQGLDGLLRI
jgi:Family of unknown function (DUF6178)